MTATLDTPGPVIARLREIEHDLAMRQNQLEAAGLAWFRAKRDKEKARAEAYIAATGPVEARKAQADLATAAIGVVEEADWEALRAVVRVLETRANVGMALLKSQARGEGRFS